MNNSYRKILYKENQMQNSIYCVVLFMQISKAGKLIISEKSQKSG